MDDADAVLSQRQAGDLMDVLPDAIALVGRRGRLVYAATRTHASADLKTPPG